MSNDGHQGDAAPPPTEADGRVPPPASPTEKAGQEWPETHVGPVGDSPDAWATLPPIPNGIWQSGPTQDPSTETAGVTGEIHAAAPSRPVLIPGYEILEELGRGGMGVVYKARQENLNRIVALKMILAGSHANFAAVSRFLREAETIARLKHPHVVQVFDYGTHEDKPFFSLEFLEGGTLANKLRGEPQPPEQAAEIVRSLAMAVQAAHDQGIVHRDLKPANVLLTADGIPKVVDFGVAKQDDSVMTVTGEVLGTPSYMSPEQAGGETGRVGPATDIYALGAILYELMTGRPPFKGASAWETIQLVRTTEPVGPRHLQPRQPLDLETICLKCLQKDPVKRYATAMDLAEDLRRYLAGETILARPVGSLTRAWRWCRRNKAVAASLATVAVAMLAATGISLAFGLSAEKARADEAVRAEGERKAKEDAETAHRDSQKQLIDITAESGLTAASQGDHALAMLWFARAAQLAADFPALEELNRLRFANWRRKVWMPEGTFALAGFRRSQDRFRAFRFSPDGHYLLTRTGEAGSMVWDRRQNRRVELPVPEGQAAAAAWEPTTGLLAVGGKNGVVRLLAPPGFAPVEEINAGDEIDVLAFDRSGHRLAWGGPTGARVWDRDTKAFSTPFLPHGGPVVTLAFSANGEMLATSARDGKARVFRTASEMPDPVFAPVPHVLAEYGISHGGPDRVAPRFADGDGSLLTVQRFGSNYGLVWHSAETGEVPPLSGPPSGGTEYFSAFDVDPDGRLIAAVWVGRGIVYLAHQQAMISAIPNHDEGDANLCEDVAFSADGKELVTCGHDMKVKTWSVARQKDFALEPSSPPIRLPHQAVRVAISGDGLHLAVALWDGTVSFWRRPEGPPLAYSIDAGGPTWPSLSPDKRLLLPRGTSFRGGAMKETRLYDAATGEPAGPPMAPGGIVIHAAFSPDGSRVAIAALTAQDRDERDRQIFLDGGRAGNVQVWDPKLGTRLVGPVPMPSEPRGIAFRPDGRTLAVVCADYHVVLVDVESGAILHEMDPGLRSSPANANLWTTNGDARFSPDGRFLVTWELAPTLHVWDVESGRLLHALEHTERVESVAFNPALPHILATGGRDSIVKVWDAASGRMLGQLQHPRWIGYLNFSPDGSELVTGCDDGLLRSWDWRTSQLNRAFPTISGLGNVDISADRRWLVAKGDVLKVADWKLGTPISPTWRIPSDDIYWGTAISAGNRRVIGGGYSGRLMAYDLEAILKPSAEPIDEMTRVAEIIAGRRILGQGTVVSINSAEWAERWDQLRRDGRSLPRNAD